jgi:hypothetical protein
MSSTNITHFANCSALVSRADFATYIQTVSDTTHFNVTYLEACKGDICNAIWGDGNGDIAGIGVYNNINACPKL